MFVGYIMLYHHFPMVHLMKCENLAILTLGLVNFVK